MALAGTRALVPDESVDGYGYDAASDTYIVRPGFPLRGRVERHASYPSPAVVVIHVGATEFPLQQRRLLIWQSTHDAALAGIGRAMGLHEPNPMFRFQWRPDGSSAPFTEVPGDFLGVNLNTSASTVTSGSRVVGQVVIEDHRVNPLDPLFDSGAPALPAEDQVVEFWLLGALPPDDQHQVYIEGITAGQFAQNVYDGVYSARDPVTGAVVPTGIQYDEAALLLMTDPVRIRLAEPIADARDWLEKRIYAPTGWAPALDRYGRISPKSQAAPSDTTALEALTNAIAEPSPDWDAGSRIINVLRFVYQRDYDLGAPDPPPSGSGEERQSQVGAVNMVIEFRDEVSVARLGEEVLEIDGSAFRAIGKVDETVDISTFSRNTFPYRNADVVRATIQLAAASGISIDEFIARFNKTETVTMVTSGPVLPVTGDIQDETGWQLAQLRGLYLLDRYSLGAPAIRLTVQREGAPFLRAGDFVLLDLTWLPDYVTGRRGLLALGQIIGAAELDCAWRQFLVEVVPVGGS